MTLGFVIPTRHRPEMAMAAVRALLAQDCIVVVSDNSSREDDVRQLRELCDAAAGPRLLYLRPPEELAMAAHWDWALEQALARTAATHFGVHYDRMVTKAGGVEQLARACARHEETLIRYACDYTYASGGGFVGWQYPATGDDVEVRTARIVELTARGTLSTIGYTWPILTNCMVPRAVFERIRARFGTICDSATPDGAFLYRFCALADRYVFLDHPLTVMYGYGLSHGQAYLRRRATSTQQDHVALWGGRPWLEAAPIPGLDLGLNIIFHEYNLVQRAAGFPPLDRDGWLGELARGLPYLEDPQELAKMRALLAEHGWREEPAPPPPPPPPLWRRALRRLRRGKARPAAPSDPLFASEAEAIASLSAGERPPAAHNPFLDVLDAVTR